MKGEDERYYGFRDAKSLPLYLLHFWLLDDLCLALYSLGALVGYRM